MTAGPRVAHSSQAQGEQGVRPSGTYVSVEPFHLFRYLDEQVFRFNTRQMKDGERFKVAAAALVGKRLTYDQLINSGATSLA